MTDGPASQADIEATLDRLAMLVGGIAKNASHIANARRVLYEAYIAEGFTEAQALDLCKSLTIT